MQLSGIGETRGNGRAGDEVVIFEAGGNPPPVYAFFNGSAELRSLSGRGGRLHVGEGATSGPIGAAVPKVTEASAHARGAVVLAGSFGSREAPRPLAALASDADHSDPAWSVRDAITISFAVATNRGGGGVTTTSVPVEDMLVFSHSLGAEATTSSLGLGLGLENPTNQVRVRVRVSVKVPQG